MKRFLSASVLWVLALPLAAVADQFDAPTLTIDSTADTKIVLTMTTGPSGAPAGFTVEWMRESDYIASGGWFEPDFANFVGTPTLNTWGELTSFSLDGIGSVTVEIGDLFDETGVRATTTDELASSTAYVFRAFVNGDGILDPSDYSANQFASTTDDADCTHTQGYWKNHEEDWMGVSLQLGTEMYTAAELDAIFETPAEGNGALILAHQLIAALLNEAVLGADLSGIQDAIDDAQTLLATCGTDRIPPHGTCFLEPSEASPIAQILDDFNNSSDGNCALAVTPRSWGAVKAAYR